MIRIIALGRIKEKYLIDAIFEYKKRISKYHQIEIIELPDVGLDDKKIALKKEKENLLKVINKKNYLIVTAIEGKEISSEDFSNMINDTFISNSNIDFVIGGSFGLDDEIKSLANFKLSLSKMTLPHQLFRVVLLEQIYRAFKIINNEEYHK